ncbi:TPA: sensor histidine kinase [Streptococcus suis]|nr:sensor histidine kinase [Streptococcus suis]
MKNKKLAKHLKCFVLDHLWVILLFLAAPVSIMIVYLTLISGNPGGTWWYYVFLSLFILLCFLLYRLYSTWDFYEILCNENKTLEDFLISEPKGREEQHYRKLVEEQHRLYLNRLARMEDKQKQSKIMIYRWVHQLKMPLSVIRLVSENKRGDSDFRKIAQSAAQIQYDLDQVLNMYKLDAIKNDFHSEKVNLHSMCKDCINELKSSFITKGIFPKLEIADDLVVYSDSKWLRFVLYQLLTNAIKYSDEGKKITVRADRSEECTSLSIQDEGCGIDPRDFNRIFDLFFTGQNGRLRGESSGLGLYMVKQSLDYLGHTIMVQSELGKGSTFTIYFHAKSEI